jgi:hypothetical protein
VTARFLLLPYPAFPQGSKAQSVFFWYNLGSLQHFDRPYQYGLLFESVLVNYEVVAGRTADPIPAVNAGEIVIRETN